MLKSLILQRRDEEPGRAKAFHQVTQQIGEREIERPRNTGAWGFRGNWATELEVRQRSRELEENRERSRVQEGKERNRRGRGESKWDTETEKQRRNGRKAERDREVGDTGQPLYGAIELTMSG